MNQPNPDQEPSMEEILASIRRIISEDGDEGDQPAEQAAEPPVLEAESEPVEPEAPAEPEPAAETEDDVLELTEVVSEQPAAEPEPEPEAISEPEPIPEPEPDPEPEPEPEPALEAEAETALDFEEPDMDDAPLDFAAPSDDLPEMEDTLSQAPADDDSLVADSTALMASAAMSKLTESPSGDAGDVASAMQMGDKTIEALVRELMRPMLKQWLDQNLPAIVERVVEREVSRVAERLHNN